MQPCGFSASKILNNLKQRILASRIKAQHEVLLLWSFTFVLYRCTIPQPIHSSQRLQKTTTLTKSDKELVLLLQTSDLSHGGETLEHVLFGTENGVRSVVDGVRLSVEHRPLAIWCQSARLLHNKRHRIHFVHKSQLKWSCPSIVHSLSERRSTRALIGWLFPAHHSYRCYWSASQRAFWEWMNCRW